MFRNNKRFDKENIQGRDDQNFALYVPEICHKDWKVVDGKVLLNFQIKNPITRLTGFLARKEVVKDMLFDDMCSSAWLLIDGQRSIYEIAKIQSNGIQNEFEDELRRLIFFIRYISKQGWIRYKKVKERTEIKIEV